MTQRNWPFRKNLFINGAIPIVALLLVGFLLGWQILEVRRLSDQIRRDSHLRGEVNHVISILDHMESEQRGYLITAAPSFVRKFVEEQVTFVRAISALADLVKDDPVHRSTVQEVRDTEPRWVSDARLEMSMRASHAPRFLSNAATGKGPGRMERMHGLLESMRAAEIRRQGEQQAHFETRSRAVDAMGIAGIIAVMGLFAFFSVRQYRDHARRLSISDEQYRRIVETAQEGIWLLDADRITTFVNEKMAALLGYHVEELRGRCLCSLLADSNSEQAAEVLARWHQGGGQPFDLGLRHRDGSTVWCMLKAAPFVDESGGHEGTLVMVTDITERRRIEQELRHSEERFRLIFDRAAMGIVSLDATGRLLSSNEAFQETVGYSSAELTSMNLADILPPEERDESFASFSKLFLGSWTSYQAQWRYLSKDGRMVWVEGTASLAKSEQHGEFCIATIFDMTERQRAETMKDEFLSVLSHELRTPLNAITGFASILDSEIVGPLSPEQHDCLAKMARGADRMLGLVDNLLDMSAVAAGRFEVRPAWTEYQGVIEEVLSTLRPLADGKGIECEGSTHFAGPVFMDGPRVIQVLINLVGNAIKFTPQGGAISVIARMSRGELLTEVTDSGVGIAAEDIPKLFTPFRQLEMSDSRPAGGTGLGLAISKAIVEEHGGRIGIESKPGVGSTFWFTLPLEREK